MSLDNKVLCILAGSSRQESYDTGRCYRGTEVVGAGAEVLQHIETKDDGEEEEESVVIEDAEVSGFQISYFGLLEEDSVVLLLLYCLLLLAGGICHLLHDLSGNASVSPLGYLVFEGVFNILVGER